MLVCYTMLLLCIFSYLIRVGVRYCVVFIPCLYEMPCVWLRIRKKIVNFKFDETLFLSCCYAPVILRSCDAVENRDTM